MLKLVYETQCSLLLMRGCDLQKKWEYYVEVTQYVITNQLFDPLRVLQICLPLALPLSDDQIQYE